MKKNVAVILAGGIGSRLGLSTPKQFFKVAGKMVVEHTIDIFEKNTPLHDGAVIVRGDRVSYATCYLPLSDNMELSKELGTRHRAGIGISEATDSMTVIVSEETGKISVAYKGRLSRGLTAGYGSMKLYKPVDKTGIFFYSG